VNRAIISAGSCGLAAGARRVEDALVRVLAEHSVAVEVGHTGCAGMCYREVMVELWSEQLGRVVYGEVTPELVPALIEAHFVEARTLDEHLVSDNERDLEAEFFALQERLVLRNCGRIDPESIDEYIAAGGYVALQQALAEGSQQSVIAEVEHSGLRGRGGGGFPTGVKWRIAHQAPGAEKYVICNADEGDPGAFMDRNLIEADPFAILEGMTIAAFAIGAQRGIIYVREEYPLAARRFANAVELATERGFLGPSVAGSEMQLEVEIVLGAGAFVCGEETALIASVEGRRGMPRRRPPYPVTEGLYGKPTLINNVETLANIPWIIAHGGSALRRHGVGASAGTKIFSIAGDLRRTGLVEVPLGITVHELVEVIGGGSSSNRRIKAVQIGGPAGGCLPASLFEQTAMDYESLTEVGTIIGSGSFIAMDSSSCMVDVARYFLSFCECESCGKCTFCRIGTTRMREILDRLCAGSGRASDLVELEQLAKQVAAHSLCGLGQAAPNPVLSTLRYFRDEYQAHLEGNCPAGRCRDLIRFSIEPTICEGCTICLDQCVTVAIEKPLRTIALRIQPETCVRCGGCFQSCPYDAISVN
jgi:NADH-quinone oxidoreductase subunit F